MKVQVKIEPAVKVGDCKLFLKQHIHQPTRPLPLIKSFQTSLILSRTTNFKSRTPTFRTASFSTFSANSHGSQSHQNISKRNYTITSSNRYTAQHTHAHYKASDKHDSQSESVLSRLDQTQKQAAFSDFNKPLLIVAGPGSGKTTTLCGRVQAMLQSGIDPHSILVIMFTNKAAADMKRKLQSMHFAEGVLPAMTVCTFHSLCFSELKNQKIIDLETTVIDSVAQKVMLGECHKQLMEEQGIKTKTRRKSGIDTKAAKNLVEFVSVAKSHIRSPQQLLEQEQIDEELVEELQRRGIDFGSESKKKIEEYATIYALYEEKKKELNGIDFDDMLFKFVSVLSEKPELLAYYRSKFAYVLVDEYQDTNILQCKLLHLLCNKNSKDSFGGRITVVGDDDQSIYGWRGADNKRNWRHFIELFPDHNEVQLGVNYRSVSSIVEACNLVIKQNMDRRKKLPIEAVFHEGEKISVMGLESVAQEAQYVADAIQSIMKNNDSIQYHDIAILYRNNNASASFELPLIQKGIPYTINNTLFANPVIQNIVAYLRLIINHRDDFSFKRVLNTPRRFPAEQVPVIVAILEKHAKFQRMSLLQAVDHIDEKTPEGLSQEQLKILRKCRDNFREWKQMLTTNANVIDLINNIITACEWNVFNTEEQESSIMQLEANIHSINSSSKNKTEEGRLCKEAVLEFLDKFSLQQREGDQLDVNKNRVRLSTIHQAKGLEWKVVFVVQVSDQILPLDGRNLTKAEMEEERRLFFVAISRAREQLILTYTNLMSPFLRELCDVGSHLVNSQSEIESPMEEIVNKIDQAISDKKPIWIIYNGGSMPGQARLVKPIEWVQQPTGFLAYCDREKIEKNYVTRKIVDAQDEEHLLQK